MKTVHWIVLVATLLAATWFVYRTRETRPRVDTTIDLNWRFTQGDPAGAQAPGFDDSGWRYISVPHDWMIGKAPERDHPSGTAGGFYPGGIGWYRKTLDLRDYPDQEQFYLLFEGVYMNADIWFNGTHLGKHAYGYASFYHDISALVRTDTLNVIAVRTDCSKLPVDRWYSGAGIFRHVRLVATSTLHVPVWSQAVTSVIDSSGGADITVKVEVCNNGKRPERFEIRFDIVDPEGQLVADEKTTRFLDPGSRELVENRFHLDDPMLWSPGSPDLYSVNCYLTERNRILDQTRTIHGIRSVEFDPDRGFVLNGQKMWMKGVCLHHDGGAFGSAVPMDAWARRLSVLKELGVNALRLAHNPHAPEVLDLCDRMGFLVIDEMYDKWKMIWDRAATDAGMEEAWRTDLANFVRRDRNHPSVVLWSVGNEVMEQLHDPGQGVAIYNDLARLVRSMDPSREVTCALHPGYKERGNEVPSSMMHVTRVVSYNYRTDSFASWHEKYPDLVFIASETKPYGTSRMEDYQVIDFSGNSWNDMDDFVAGQFIWAGIDYLGESAGWPDRGLRHGLLETTGFIKPHAWYIGSRYLEVPMVKLTVKDSVLADSLNNLQNWQVSWAGAPLADHWSFGPDSGDKEAVVFTNCQKVELYLNGTLISSHERADFADGVIRTAVPYQPGQLVAHAFFKDDGGKLQRVSDTLITAHEPYALAMHPDREEIRANNVDLVHITTRVVDSIGTLNPHSSHLVSYKLDGPGRIRVVDNGDMADHTDPTSATREVRKGKQLLILQAGSEPGDLIISASAAGLRPASVKIKSK